METNNRMKGSKKIIATIVVIVVILSAIMESMFESIILQAYEKVKIESYPLNISISLGITMNSLYNILFSR